ncbi:MAG: hypothetical protein MPJ50_17075 [Pirellulales bacterium]|nr:hypothetical protein [Pirellulales bacterium]
MPSINPYSPPSEHLQLDFGPFDLARHGLLRVRRIMQFADITRRYRIEVDGQTRSSIRQGKSAEIPLEPGQHQLIMRIDWFSSPPLDFRIRAGEVAIFTCSSNMRGWRLWISGVYAFYYLIRRNEYLSVEWLGAEPAVIRAEERMRIPLG